MCSTPFQKSSSYNYVPPLRRNKCDDERKMKIRFVFKRRRITRRTTTALKQYRIHRRVQILYVQSSTIMHDLVF